MDKKLEAIVKALQEKFGSSIEEFRDEVHVFVRADQIVDALTLLRDKYEFELLSALTATDYHPQQTPRFHLIYQISSLAKNITLQLRVSVNGDQLLPSAWPVDGTLLLAVPVTWQEVQATAWPGVLVWLPVAGPLAPIGTVPPRCCPVL